MHLKCQANWRLGTARCAVGSAFGTEPFTPRVRLSSLLFRLEKVLADGDVVVQALRCLGGSF